MRLDNAAGAGRVAVAACAAAFLLAACAAPSIDDSLSTDVPLPDRTSEPPKSSKKPAEETAPPSTPKGPETFALTVSLAGAGKGTMTSSPTGITCTGTTCTGTFAKGTAVTLSPSPEAGSFFTAWSGGCTGSGACVAQVDRDVTISAQLDSIEGTWSGSYTNSRNFSGCNFANAGNLSITFAANGTAFTDTGDITGLEIRQLSNCQVVGKANGNASSAGVTVTTTGLTGAWTFDVQGVNGSLAFPFTGKLTGKTFTGTWTCPTCTGSFTLTKP